MSSVAIHRSGCAGETEVLFRQFRLPVLAFSKLLVLPGVYVLLGGGWLNFLFFYSLNFGRYGS